MKKLSRGTITCPETEAPFAEIQAHAIAAALAIASHKQSKGPDVQYFLMVGELLYIYRLQFKSNKVFGKFLKEQVPDIAAMRNDLRSNCIWLHKKTSGRGKRKLLRLLGVKNLRDFRSNNPTVIRRAYREAINASA